MLSICQRNVRKLNCAHVTSRMASTLFGISAVGITRASKGRFEPENLGLTRHVITNVGNRRSLLKQRVQQLNLAHARVPSVGYLPWELAHAPHLLRRTHRFRARPITANQEVTGSGPAPPCRFGGTWGGAPCRTAPPAPRARPALCCTTRRRGAPRFCGRWKPVQSRWPAGISPPRFSPSTNSLHATHLGMSPGPD